jgi:hypothetical protein
MIKHGIESSKIISPQLMQSVYCLHRKIETAGVRRSGEQVFKQPLQSFYSQGFGFVKWFLLIDK